MSGVNDSLPGDAPQHSDIPPEAIESEEAGSGSREATRFTLEEILRPLAIAGMLTCIGVSLIQVLVLLSPTWPAVFFSWLIFVVCLESIHAQRLVARRSLASRDRFRFRFVEWVVLLMVVRLGPYLQANGRSLASDLASWSANPLTFVDLGFVINSLLVLAFWVGAMFLSRTIQELEASPIEKMPAVTDPNHYLRSTMPRHGRTDRQARLNSIISTFFWGGVLLLLLSGFSRVDVRELVVLQHGRSSGVILNALIYFLLGFLVISQAQFTILKANWELQDIPVLGKVGRRWLWLVVGFLLAIGLLAALLPVSYSVGLIDTLSTIVRWIVYALVQIAFLFLFAISYLIGLLLRLFTGRSDSAGPDMMSRPTPPPPPPAVDGGGPAPWWQLVRTLLFWALLGGLLLYSGFYFMRDRWGIFRSLSLSRLWRWLVGAWKGVTARMRRTMRTIGEELARRRAARQARAASRVWRFLSLRRLSPRDRVRYFYLAMLRRSAEQGSPRQPAMTPLEFEPVVAKVVPDAGEQVRELTDAFLEARYSEHLVDTQSASAAQRLWRKVQRALRRRRRQASAGAPPSGTAAP